MQDTPLKTLRALVDEAFSDEGPLACTLPAFEPRDSQRQMAAAAADIFTDGGLLLVEAGTGTGKTLAYLVPAILSGKRVLISTGTKNLQDQIYDKDLPALREALQTPFTAAYMKGRGNYLCLHRFEEVRAGAADTAPLPLVDRTHIDMIREWALQTDTGDRGEIEDLPDDLPLWADIAATSENCLGSECPEFDECFVTRMRRRAVEADLVIVNHHLLCADASVRQSAYGEVIPSCSYAVIDEAHQLEDVATQYFGISVSNYRVEELARDTHRTLLTEVGDVAAPHGDRHAASDIHALTDRARDHARVFFGSFLLSSRHSPSSGRGGRTRLTSEALAGAGESGRTLRRALTDLETALTQLANASESHLALARRAAEIRDHVTFLLMASDPDFVYFLEIRGTGVFLRAAPIDVSTIVRDNLLKRHEGMVLTSATLTVDDSFAYVRGRLGLTNAVDMRLPSEFDFRKQSLLYLPPRMPDPRDRTFVEAAARELVEILTRTKGRAFVLFTSYANLHAVHQRLVSVVGYPMLVHGTAPRSVLLREFRTTPGAVLLATSSFWQGVDVAGDALSCVVVDKLPFASPSDPITAARMEAIEARGGDAFSEYQVPLAVLSLLQGLGRLIRHRRDRGVLVVLDARIRTKGYGRRFLASLPPAPITHSVTDIGDFLSNSQHSPGAD